MGTKFGLLTVEEAREKDYTPAQVFVGGIRVVNVALVNDTEGWVDYYLYDEYIAGSDEIPTKRVYGDVLYIPAKGDLVI